MTKPYTQLNKELNLLPPSIADNISIQKLCFLAGITTDKTDPPNKVLLSDYLRQYDVRFLTGQAKIIIERIASELEVELPAELPAPPIQRRSRTSNEEAPLVPVPAEAESRIKAENVDIVSEGQVRKITITDTDGNKYFMLISRMTNPSTVNLYEGDSYETTVKAGKSPILKTTVAKATRTEEAVHQVMAKYSESLAENVDIVSEGQVRKITITGTDGNKYFMLISRMTEPPLVNLYEGDSYETTVKAGKSPILKTTVAKTTRTEEAVHQVMAKYSESLQASSPSHPPVCYETESPLRSLKQDQLNEFKEKCPLAEKVHLGEPRTGQGTIFQIHQKNGKVQNLLVITNGQSHTIHVQGRAGKPTVALGGNRLQCVAEKSQTLLQQQPSASVAHGATVKKEVEDINKGIPFG